MTPAILNEIPSATHAAANGRDDVVAAQGHLELKDTRKELEDQLPVEPDKENAVGRYAKEDDNPFDSDSDSDGDGDDDEFMPRGQREDPTKGKSSQKKFVPTKAEKNNPGKEGAREAEKPKDAQKADKNVKAAKTAKTTKTTK